MVNGINLNQLVQNLLSQISNKEQETDLTDAEKNAIRDALGLAEDDPALESAYKDAMKNAGAENETERMKVFNQIKEMLETIIEKATDKGAAVNDIKNLLSTVASAKDAQTALTTLVDQLHVKSQKAADSGKTPEEKIHQNLERFLSSQSNITQDDYNELMRLLSETGIPYELETNACGKMTIKFYDASGKSYKFTTNQFNVEQDKLISDYVDSQLDAKSYDSIFTLESKCVDLGISPDDLETCADENYLNGNGKYKVTYKDKQGNKHTATIAIKTEMPKYEGERIVNANVGVKNIFSDSRFEMVDGEFRINRDVVSREFAEWEKQNGPITTLEDLQKAMKSGENPEVNPDKPEAKPDSAKEAKVQDIIKKLVSGNYTWGDFVNELAKLHDIDVAGLGIKDVDKKLREAGIIPDLDSKDRNITEEAGYNLTFKANGKTYTIKGLDFEKVANGKANDMLGFTKQEFENAGISKSDVKKYFDIAIYEGNDAKSGALGFVLKNDIRQKLNINDNATLQQLMYAIKNSEEPGGQGGGNPGGVTPGGNNSGALTPGDVNHGGENPFVNVEAQDINDLIKNFVSGNYKWGDFVTQLAKLTGTDATGLTAGKLSDVLKKAGYISYNNDETNGYNVDIKLNGTIYNVKVNWNDVINGELNDHLAYTATELSGLSNDIIAKFFKASAWEVNGENKTPSMYILTDEGKKLLGDSLEGNTDVNALKALLSRYEEITPDRITEVLSGIENDNISDLVQIADKVGVKITIIQDKENENSYEVKVEYNGNVTSKIINNASSIFVNAINNSTVLEAKTGTVITDGQSLARAFASGDLTWGEFLNELAKLANVDVSKEIKNDDKWNKLKEYLPKESATINKDGYNFTFKLGDTTYQVANVDWYKVTNEYENVKNGGLNDILIFNKSELESWLSDGDVTSYFNVTASSVDADGNVTPLYYTIKPEMLKALKLDANADAAAIKDAIIADAEAEAAKLPTGMNSLENVWNIVNDNNNPNHDKIHVTYDKDTKKYIVSMDGTRATKSFDASDLNDMYYNVYLTENDKEMAELLEYFKVDCELNNEQIIEKYKALKEIKQGINIAENYNKLGGYIKTTGPVNGKYTITIADRTYMDEKKEIQFTASCTITLDTNKKADDGRTVTLSYNDKKVMDEYNHKYALMNALKSLSTAKGYQDTLQNDAEVKEAIDYVINLTKVKNTLKETLKKEYNFTDGEFETFYSDLIKDFAERNADNIKQLLDGEYTVKYWDVLTALERDINIKLNERNAKQETERNEDIAEVKAAVADTLKGYPKGYPKGYSMDTFKDEAGEILDNLSDTIKDTLSKRGYDVSKWDTDFSKAKTDYFKTFTGAELAQAITNEKIFDEFLEELMSKLKKTDNGGGNGSIGDVTVNTEDKDKTTDFNGTQEQLNAKIDALLNKYKAQLKAACKDIPSEVLDTWFGKDGSTTDTDWWKGICTKVKANYKIVNGECEYKPQDVLDKATAEIQKKIDEYNKQITDKKDDKKEQSTDGTTLATTIQNKKESIKQALMSAHTDWQNQTASDWYDYTKGLPKEVYDALEAQIKKEFGDTDYKWQEKFKNAWKEATDLETYNDTGSLMYAVMQNLISYLNNPNKKYSEPYAQEFENLLSSEAYMTYHDNYMSSHQDSKLTKLALEYYITTFINSQPNGQKILSRLLNGKALSDYINQVWQAGVKVDVKTFETLLDALKRLLTRAA